MEMDVLSMTTKSSFAVKGASLSLVARLHVCSYFDLCIIIIHTYLGKYSSLASQTLPIFRAKVWLARPGK